MTGAATPTTASSPGYTVSRTAVSGPAVAKVPVIGTGWRSSPVAVPVTVYWVPNVSFCVSVHLLRSAEITPVTGVPSAAVMVRVSITPWVTVTVTCPAGASPVLPNSGVALTAAGACAVVRGALVAVGKVVVPSEPAAPDLPGSAFRPAGVTVADDAGDVEDDELFPQPVFAIRRPRTTRAEANRPARRRQMFNVVPFRSGRAD